MSVIWITGLSGSGKTTLSKAIKEKLTDQGVFAIHLDGDEVREIIHTDLGYSPEDRFTHISRIQRMAKLISEQDIIVIVSALYFDEKLSEWNKNNYKKYLEVYIHASLELLHKRDQKNIYSRFSENQLQNVMGLDIPYSSPINPHLTFYADEEIDPKLMASQIIQQLGKQNLKCK